MKQIDEEKMTTYWGQIEIKHGAHYELSFDLIALQLKVYTNSSISS